MSQYSDNSNPIGVFDSGIGGLTVIKRLIEHLPQENIIYFGDTARVPYGTKSNDTVIKYAIQDAEFLISKNVKMIVVACNTVSSVAIEVLQDKYNIPVIGMIKPGARYAYSKSQNKKIGVIGTSATIENKAYSNELFKIDKNVEITEKACPLFVPLAEEGWQNHKATLLTAKEYLVELKDYEIDTLILGCTHYPVLWKTIQKVMGKNVKLIDSGIAASIEVEQYLTLIGIKNQNYNLGYQEFYVSDMPRKFKYLAELFLGRNIGEVKQIKID